MWGALALAISTNIGAGVLGLPKALQLVGFSGIFIGIIVAFFLTLSAIMLSDMLKRETKPIQIPALISQSLGPGWKYFIYFTLIFSMYGAISAYLIGFGSQLNALFGINEAYGGIFLFVIGAWLIHKGTMAIEKLAIPLAFALVVFLIILSGINIINFNQFEFATSSVGNTMKFTGTILFALFGLNVLPEINFLSKGKAARVFALTVLICLILYLGFAITTVGVLGFGTTDLGTKGLALHYGGIFNVIISLFTMTALFTSFLGIGLSTRHIYQFDFGLSRVKSTLAVVVPPLIIFLTSGFFGFGFLDILGMAGELTLPMFAITASYAYYKVLPAIKTRLPAPKIFALVTALFYMTILGVSLFEIIL